MSQKSGMTFDTSEFEAEMKDLTRNVMPSLIEQGLRKAGQQLKLDADNIEPKTPHDEGNLKGSGRVSKVNTQGGDFFVEVGYFMPYAARLHEMEHPNLDNWNEPGSGPKYLSSKLIKYKNDYVEIVASVIRGGL